MRPSALIADLFKYNTKYLVRYIQSLDRSQLFVQPGFALNPIIWIFGHVVVMRGEMAELVGIEPQTTEFLPFFASGTFPRSNPAEYPHVDDLVFQWERLGQALSDTLNAGGDELLNRRAWGKYETIGKHIVGGYIHETYHIGQITYVAIMTEKTLSASSRVNLATKRKNSTGKILLDSLKSVLTVK